MAALAANRVFKRAGTVRRTTKAQVAANAVIYNGAMAALKIAKGALSPAYMGTMDAHESQTVSISD